MSVHQIFGQQVLLEADAFNVLAPTQLQQAATLASLHVTGSSQFDGSVNFTTGPSFTNLHLAGNLEVDGTSLLHGAVTFGVAPAFTNLNVSDTVTAAHLHATGTSTLDGVCTFNAAPVFNVAPTFTDLTLSGTVTAAHVHATGTSTFDGVTTFNATPVCANLTATNTVTAAHFTSTGTSTFTGVATFTGTPVCSNNLTVNNTVTAAHVTSTGTSTLTGAVTCNNDLSVAGTTNLDGTIHLTNANTDVNFTGNVTINNVSAGALSVQVPLTVPWTGASPGGPLIITRSNTYQEYEPLPPANYDATSAIAAANPSLLYQTINKILHGSFEWDDTDYPVINAVNYIKWTAIFQNPPSVSNDYPILLQVNGVYVNGIFTLGSDGSVLIRKQDLSNFVLADNIRIGACAFAYDNYR